MLTQTYDSNGGGKPPSRDLLVPDEGFVAGRLYLRSAAELTPTQLKSALDHIKKVKFDSAAAAIMQVPKAQLFAALQGRRRAGSVYLHRCAVSVIAKVGDYPVIGNSFSYEFPQLLGFVGDSDKRIARITVARSRSIIPANVDMYGAASDAREADSFGNAGFRKVREAAVRAACRDLVTELSSGREHEWYLMEDAEFARQQELKLLNDNRLREIIDEYARNGHVSETAKATWRELTGKFSATPLGPSVEVTYGYGSAPLIPDEPSLTIEQAVKLGED